MTHSLRDAESWFRAETYYTRILNVSSVSAESSLFFAESVFSSQFCDVLWPVVYRRRWQFIDVNIDRGGCWRSAWRWVMIQSGNVLYTYTKRLACFCWVSVFDDEARFCRVSFGLVSYLLTRRVIAVVCSRVCVCVHNKRMKYTSKRRDIFDP